MAVMSIALLSAVEQLAHLRSGVISPVELAGEYIARIEALNPQLNAFVDFDGTRRNLALGIYGSGCRDRQSLPDATCRRPRQKREGEVRPPNGIREPGRQAIFDDEEAVRQGRESSVRRHRVDPGPNSVLLHIGL